MPLESRHGVYLVTEGPKKGTRVSFTFEPHGGGWVLIKDGLARHELHCDEQGNLLIDRETDLRKEQQIEYASPVMLLPARVDSQTSLKGTTRVVVTSTRSSVKYHGVCTWWLDFIGLSHVDTPVGIRVTYRLRARHEIHLPLAQISMRIGFEYARGEGMITTGVEEVIRPFGLFTVRDIWRLERFRMLTSG